MVGPGAAGRPSDDDVAVVRTIVEGGITSAGAAAATGLPEFTIRRWVTIYDEAGVQALEDDDHH